MTTRTNPHPNEAIRQHISSLGRAADVLVRAGCRLVSATVTSRGASIDIAPPPGGRINGYSSAAKITTPTSVTMATVIDGVGVAWEARRNV